MQVAFGIFIIASTLISPSTQLVTNYLSTNNIVMMVDKKNQKLGAENVYRKACLQIVETETTISMLNKMIRNGVSTNDVMSFSINQASLRKVHKDTSRKIEKTAMKAKRNDALALAKRLRRKRYEAKLKVLKSYENNQKAYKSIRNINKNMREYKSTLLREKYQKVEHLKNKYEYVNRRTLKSCNQNVRLLLERLEMFNKVPEVESPLGPMICHPSIKLDENELMVLNRGPKFMVRGKVPLSEFSLELEKSVIKHKYNSYI